MSIWKLWRKQSTFPSFWGLHGIFLGFPRAFSLRFWNLHGGFAWPSVYVASFTPAQMVVSTIENRARMAGNAGNPDLNIPSLSLPSHFWHECLFGRSFSSLSQTFLSLAFAAYILNIVHSVITFVIASFVCDPKLSRATFKFFPVISSLPSAWRCWKKNLVYK